MILTDNTESSKKKKIGNHPALLDSNISTSNNISPLISIQKQAAKYGTKNMLQMCTPLQFDVSRIPY